MQRALVFDAGTSDKFWEIEVHGEHTVRFGRAGTQGQVKTKAFASEEQARVAAEKLAGREAAQGLPRPGHRAAGDRASCARARGQRASSDRAAGPESRARRRPSPGAGVR